MGTIITGPLTMRADTTQNLNIGANTYFNTETRFGIQESEITIGDNVLVGPIVSFESASHHTIYEEGVGRGLYTKEIKVKDRSWIGAGVIILQGGVPARLLKNLGDDSVKPQSNTSELQ